MQYKLLFFALIISSYFLSFLDKSKVIALGNEDGWIESLGAGFFLLASCMLFFCFLISNKRDNEIVIKNTANYRKYFFLLLAAFLFLCFGEEISWGQRILGWETPEFIKTANAQEETNLHNLWLFHAGNQDGSSKSGLEKLFVLTSLFSLFTFLLFILIPLLDKISSPVNCFFRKIQLPTIPFWIGGLVLTNYFVFHIFTFYFSGSPDLFLRSINELKESNYALIYTVFALEVFTINRLLPVEASLTQSGKKF